MTPLVLDASTINQVVKSPGNIFTSVPLFKSMEADQSSPQFQLGILLRYPVSSDCQE
jgi:hypothetical protein